MVKDNIINLARNSGVKWLNDDRGSVKTYAKGFAFRGKTFLRGEKLLSVLIPVIEIPLDADNIILCAKGIIKPLNGSFAVVIEAAMGDVGTFVTLLDNIFQIFIV